MPAADAEKPPPFYTEIECGHYIDVEIDPSELEEAGWVYVGQGELPTTEHVMYAVQKWHDDEHPGPFRWCPLRPCLEVRVMDG